VAGLRRDRTHRNTGGIAMTLPEDYLLAHTVHEPLTADPDAPTVVIGSSIGTTSRVWTREVRALRAEFRVITYEHPGHGGDVADVPSSSGAGPAPAGPYTISELARAVLRILDLYGVASAHVVGLSLGGAIAQWLGIHAADRVRSLGIVCSSASFAPASLWTERAAMVRAAGTVAVPGIADGIGARWFSESFRQDHPEVVTEFVDGLGAIDPEGYAACCEAVGDWDAVSDDSADDLRRITAPTLLIAGSEDPASPVAGMRLMHDRIARSRLEIVPASHLAPIEVDLSELLLDHVRSAR
jgi:3-oxoadipate enol-lactonase/4-carboxymuconolactone decarboxylase